MKPTQVTFWSIAMFAFATAALAAENDTYAGRIDIGALPFAATMDTAAATTDADDDELNTFCGAPQTDASVWFEYTAPADGMVLVDLSASSYPAGVLVGVGSPGSFSLWACRPTSLQFIVDAGVTYAIMAFDDQSDGGGNGGTLAISVEDVELPDRPAVSLTLDSTAEFHTDGTVTLTGTVTCTGADFTYLTAGLYQRVGRVVILGDGAVDDFTCDGTTRDWSMLVWNYSGSLFRGGPASVELYSQVCGNGGCGWARLEQDVQLKGRWSR